MGSVLEVTETNFVETVVKSDIPVLVDFWSPTCQPCRLLAPVIDALASENNGEYKFAKINVYDAPQVGAQYGVDMLPTILFFHNGRVVERMLGVQDKDKLQETLDEITR
ncbi:MAG: thioredoxin [Planctomycetaceae bacterium]|jgi:thioredoxin 1|nr:thioredoxin [Planctomycetaceae bacterium]